MRRRVFTEASMTPEETEILRPSGVFRSVAARNRRDETATAALIVLSGAIAMAALWFAFG